MITRLSKIARLPAHMREQLNHRLHDGEISRTILPWVNSLPETQKVMIELYRGKPITHQNLSEWRHTGYQDWLSHQQRLEWNGRLAEEESEVTQQNRCEDGYEAMGFQFLYDIAQARKAMQQIKNPNHRWDRLETLTREFCRLQNAFNWSRRVGLEFDKFKLDHPPVADDVRSLKNPEIQLATDQVEDLTKASAAPASSFCILPSTLPNAGGASVPASRTPLTTSAHELIEVAVESEPSTAPFAASPNSDLPSPISNSHPSVIALATAETPKLLNSSTPTNFQPLPPLAPPIPTPQFPPPISHLRTSSPPLRGRRFICIEG